MDTESLVQILPHYVAMVLLGFLALGVLEAVLGDVGFWIELAAIAVVIGLYRPVVLRLGIAPPPWRNH